MCCVLCRLLLLSIHGVSVSRSPRSLPGSRFKLCVLYVSPERKDLAVPWQGRASSGHEWLCPMSSSAGLAPGPHSLCPGVCGAQGAHKSPSKIHLRNRCESNLSTWLASLLPSPLLPQVMGALAASGVPGMLQQGRDVPWLSCSRTGLMRPTGRRGQMPLLADPAGIAAKAQHLSSPL